MIDPAPGEDVSAALALVNTRYVDLGELVDDIADPDAAREWLASRAEAPRDMPLGNQEVVRVHELRAVVRELLCARSEGRAPREEALEELAEVTAAAPGSVRLTVRDGDLSSDWVAAGGDPLERALAWIAADAIALATDDRGARLAACAAPSCTRLLLRDHNRRRWCSTPCGDRVRTARYRERQRGERPDTA